MIGVVQNQSCITIGIISFKSLKNGVKSEKITPKPKAKRVCKIIIGGKYKKALPI
jgi:hypothetical protein